MRSDVTVSWPRWVMPALWAGLPVAGAAAGWALPGVAHWVTGLPVPFMRGPFLLVDKIPQPQVTIGAVIVGVLAGLALAYAIRADLLEVDVAADVVRLRRGGQAQEFPRAAVRHVFADRKHVTLLDAAGAELAREPHDLPVVRLASAFVAQGYPWRAGGDPYESRYRRWIEDEPDLSASVNALLKVRERALAKRDADEVRQLRGELAKAGIVVREDDRRRQFWRNVEKA